MPQTIANEEQFAEFCRPAVKDFAMLLERRLRANDGKGGWAECRNHWLLTRILDNLTTGISLIRSDIKGVDVMLQTATILTETAVVKLSDYGPHLKTTIEDRIQLANSLLDVTAYAMMMLDNNSFLPSSAPSEQAQGDWNG